MPIFKFVKGLGSLNDTAYFWFCYCLTIEKIKNVGKFVTFEDFDLDRGLNHRVWWFT